MNATDQITAAMKPATLTAEEKAVYAPAFWAKASRVAPIGPSLPAMRSAMTASGWTAASAFEYRRPGLVAYVSCADLSALVFQV